MLKKVKRKSVKEMGADFFREVGVLFFVFGTLEGVMNVKELKELGFTLPGYAIAVAATTVVPMFLGVILERRRNT